MRWNAMMIAGMGLGLLAGACGDDDGSSTTGDPCVDATHDCVEMATCVTVVDGAEFDFRCDCPAGWAGDGRISGTGCGCGSGTAALSINFVGGEIGYPEMDFDPELGLDSGAPDPVWTFSNGTVVNGRSIDVTISDHGAQSVVLEPLALAPAIQQLDLYNDQITDFPSGLECLTSLTSLNLGYNRLSGAIPAEVLGLTSLWGLNLFLNGLSGAIPAGIGDLTELRSLTLADNNFTGEIPPELGNLTNLRQLYLGSNDLTGTIPRELGNLIQLDTLQLGSNDLTGVIPTELGNLTALDSLDLSWTQLSDVEDGIFSEMPAIRELLISNNTLSATAVDAVVAQIHGARGSYVANEPTLALEGFGSGVPSGSYTDPAVDPGPGSSNADWEWNGTGHDPLTGQAMIYDLEQDVRGEGFTLWTVTFAQN